MKQSYLSKTEEFDSLYSTADQNIFLDPKIEYRYFCYRYLDYIRNITLPKIQLNKKNEAVLVECRKFPHIEFIIRNAILKLGPDWSHTILCGNLNYDYMLDICNKISNKIKVLKIPYDNLSQSTYSKYLASLNFWNLLLGSKILIYQEDSAIFRNNINDFIDWDYIGAPFTKNSNLITNDVGNGGLSLRTKRVMIDVIKTVNIEDTIPSDGIYKYMIKNGMSIIPEDMYFVTNMMKYNIGKIADQYTASKFSSESIFNSESFGGHNFWLSNSQWKDHLYNKIVKQFQPKYKMHMIEHRGGWRSILDKLLEKDFFNTKSNYVFYDVLEHYFLWKTDHVCENKWLGVIHCTQSVPNHLSHLDISKIFDNPNFIKSLKSCIALITLSSYLTNFIKNKLISMNIDTPVIFIKHPTITDGIKPFSMKKYIKNKNKMLVQIGQQCRKLTSIYRVKTKLNKLWLTGNTDFELCKKMLITEQKALKIDDLDIDEVKVDYTSTESEYDQILSENIVFLDLFDSSANNAIVECIARNTPILVNKLPAVVEYLGLDYPLYYDDLKEIDDLLSIKNITKAHKYLKNLDKKYLDTNKFTEKLFNIVAKIEL